MKNTSISLGNHFDQFISSQVSTGRYKNVSEVVRAGLRLLEDEESKIVALKEAINKGLESPRIENFDFKENLKNLKAKKIIRTLGHPPQSLHYRLVFESILSLLKGGSLKFNQSPLRICKQIHILFCNYISGEYYQTFNHVSKLTDISCPIDGC